jgi:hypothetical protein
MFGCIMVMNRLLNKKTRREVMKFFQILLVLAVTLTSGCMTHYANYRAVSSGYYPALALDGGHVSYSRTESYSYDSGYMEYPRYYLNSLPAYAPVEVRTYHFRPPLPRYHPIPNPFERGGYRRRSDGYHRRGGSPADPVPAPPARRIMQLLPQ